MKLITVISAIVGLVFVWPSSADVPRADAATGESVAPEAAQYRKEIRESLSGKGKVKGIQQLPIDKLYFVEADQGSYIVSADGRFVFEGKLKDVWHRKTISNLDAARSTERTPLSNIGFKPEEQLATFTIGNPKVKRKGAVFVDPTSPMTITALAEIMKDESNTNWTVILMPLVGGDQAMDRSRRLWCAIDRKGATKDLINGTATSLQNLKQPCSEEPIVMAMMLADIFRISYLPHFIREDGLRSEGLPENFKAWYSQP